MSTIHLVGISLSFLGMALYAFLFLRAVRYEGDRHSTEIVRRRLYDLSVIVFLNLVIFIHFLFESTHEPDFASGILVVGVTITSIVSAWLLMTAIRYRVR